MAGVRTMVVWCPDWPVVASGNAAAVPVAVVFANRVIACSVAARVDGVAIGLRRREAQGRCPELRVIEQDLGRDARAFEPVLAAIEAFTPKVEVERPGVALFGTRGPSRYFGGDRSLAAKVAAAVDAVLAPLGAPRCQIGVADGPFAAQAAARAAAQAAATTVASAIVVPPRGSADFVASFPVAVLDRPELVDLLVRLGLRTLGDLAVLPADMVLARFGHDGALAHRLARGLDERPLAARPRPPDLSVVAELDPPAEQVEMVAFVAKALADEMHQRLAARGLACTRIAIEAETEHGEQLVRLWRHDGALTARAIAERVRWQLDGWFHSGATTAGVTLIRLIPDEVKPDHGRQLGFWGGSAAADDRAARALARVQGMLGPGGVVTAVVAGGRDPAAQVQLVPWGDPRPDVIQPDSIVGSGATASAAPARRGRARGRGRPGSRAGAPAGALGPSNGGAAAAPSREVPPWPGRLPAPAPAVVYPEHRSAEVRDGTGQLIAVTARGQMSAAPVTLSIAGGPPTRIAAWAGPWPAEERWWDPHAARRRARFQLCLEGGIAHIAVLESGKWWVEATYD
jgi:protein ImuB